MGHDPDMQPVFVAPTLPMTPERLASLIGPYISTYLVDPLNYRGQVAGTFHRQGWDEELTTEWSGSTVSRLRAALSEKRG